MKLLRHQRGDTIVEVLIAVAMLAFVITTASATSTRSSNTVRASQERGEALKLAQSQIEYIISNKGLPTGKECFNSAGEAKDAGDKECAYSAGDGSGCEISTKGYCYTVNIGQNPAPATASDPTISMQYNVNVDWDSLDGDKDTVAIVYKMLLPNPSYVAPAMPPGAGANTGLIGATENAPKPCEATNTCPTNGVYDYRLVFEFKSTNVPASEIASCTWDFGYGTATQTILNCEVGDTVSHEFPENPAYPEGGPCTTGNFNRTDYTVTMLITKKSGAKVPTSTHTARLPYCNT